MVKQCYFSVACAAFVIIKVWVRTWPNYPLISQWLISFVFCFYSYWITITLYLFERDRRAWHKHPFSLLGRSSKILKMFWHLQSWWQMSNFWKNSAPVTLSYISEPQFELDEGKKGFSRFFKRMLDVISLFSVLLLEGIGSWSVNYVDLNICL